LQFSGIVIAMSATTFSFATPRHATAKPFICFLFSFLALSLRRATPRLISG
jgi:hypothetical protein